MRDEGAEFRHLYDVCCRALSLGNPHPAVILLRAYRDEARMLEGKAHRKLDFRAARKKARRLGKLLAEHQGEAPQPGYDAESPHAAVHRRRQRDPLANMVLSPGQIRAAVEIRDVFEATVRGLTARVRPTDRPHVDVGKVPSAPFAGMPDGVAQARRDNYLPWVAAQQRIVAKDERGDLKAVDLVLSVIVDRTPLGRIEMRYHMRHGILGRVLREALDDYAKRMAPKKRLDSGRVLRYTFIIDQCAPVLTGGAFFAACPTEAGEPPGDSPRELSCLDEAAYSIESLADGHTMCPERAWAQYALRLGDGLNGHGFRGPARAGHFFYNGMDRVDEEDDRPRGCRPREAGNG